MSPGMITACQRAALQYIARRPNCLLKELAFELGTSECAAACRANRLRLNGLVRKPMGTRSFVLTRAGVEALTGSSIEGARH